MDKTWPIRQSEPARADNAAEHDAAAARQLLDLANCSSDMFAVFDSEDRLCFANTAYCETYRCDPCDQPLWRDIMRANFVNGQGPLIVTDDIETWLTNAIARRATQAFRCFEAALHGGRWLWITETVTPDGRMLLYATESRPCAPRAECCAPNATRRCAPPGQTR